MLGRDCARHEYWHFRDDASRVYVRSEEVLLSTTLDEMTGEPLVEGTKHHWFYYEDEESFDGLVESLNPKGVRERKLQENLRKLKEKLKLKKPKRASAAAEEKPVEESKDAESEHVQTNGDVEMTEANPVENTEMHAVFETDLYAGKLEKACWFGKKIPPKRRFKGRNASNTTGVEE